MIPVKERKKIVKSTKYFIQQLHKSVVQLNISPFTSRAAEAWPLSPLYVTTQVQVPLSFSVTFKTLETLSLCKPVLG